MEGRGGATNKRTHVEFFFKKGERRCALDKKEKAARTVLFTLQRAQAALAEVSPGLSKSSSSLLLQIRDGMLVPHKEKGGGGVVAGLLLLEGAGEDMWSHENSLYHSGLGRLRPEHDVCEGGILTRPACANTGGCCGVMFCRDYGTLRTGS